MSEHGIQSAILAALLQKRIFAWRNNSGVANVNGRFIRFGHPGSPDILGVLPGGRMLCIEVKSSTGRQSRLQAEFQKTMEHYGALYVLARSVDDAMEAVLPACGQ